MISTKMPENIRPMDFGDTFSVSNFLYSVTLRPYSNDVKEADILDLCGLPLNDGSKIEVFYTETYGKKYCVP